MIRKLLFLGATVWLGKKGYDALMAAQTQAAAPAGLAGSADLTDTSGADDDGALLNPVLDSGVAGRLQDAKLEAAEVHDPA